MRYFYHTYLILFLLFVSACKQEEPKIIAPLTTLDDGVKVEIIHPAGTYWGKHAAYLPLPFHVGLRELDTFLIMGEPIKKGSKLNIDPIGVALIKNEASTRHYILSIPQDSTKRTIPQKDFLELSTVNSSILWIIEQYMLHYKASDKTNYLIWQDKSGAEKILLK